MKTEGSSPQQSHRVDQRRNPQDAYDSAQVVGQAVQADFSGDVRQNFPQQVCRSHPKLDGAKDVFDRTAAQSHGSRVFVQA